MTDLLTADRLVEETPSRAGSAENAGGVSAAALGGLLFVLIGSAYIVFGLDYRLGSLRSMGPGMFPVAGGALLVLLGVVVAAAGRRSSGSVSFTALRPLVAIVVSVVVFALLVERAGLAVAAPILIAGVVLATGQGSWKFAALLAAPLTLGAVIVFPILLGVPLRVLP